MRLGAIEDATEVALRRWNETGGDKVSITASGDRAFYAHVLDQLRSDDKCSVIFSSLSDLESKIRHFSETKTGKQLLPGDGRHTSKHMIERAHLRGYIHPSTNECNGQPCWEFGHADLTEILMVPAGVA